MGGYKTLDQLNFDQQFLFLVACLGRTKNLYSRFQDEIKDDRFEYSLKFKGAFEKINAFYEECLSIAFKSEKEFKTNFQLFYDLAPSYEEYSTAYSTIATEIALMCVSVGEFYQNRDTQFIQEILVHFEEVINIVKSDEFYQQHPEGDAEEYIEAFFKKEHADQLEIIQKISESNFNQSAFQGLINRYEIQFKHE